MISVLLVINNEKIIKKLKNICYEELYKKCGFKSNENFEKLYEKKIMDNNYEYWGKKEGKNIYKYILNNITYYNKLLIIKTKNMEFQNITEDDYINIFDSINNKDVNNKDINNKDVINKDINNKDVNNKDVNNKDVNNNNDVNNDEDIESLFTIDSELSEEPYIFSSDDEN